MIVKARQAKTAGALCIFSLLAPVPLAVAAPFDATRTLHQTNQLEHLIVKVEASNKVRRSAKSRAFKEALANARKGKYDAAFSHAKRDGNPLARKIIEWQYVQGSKAEAGFDRIAAFMAANPKWPNSDRIRARAELALHVRPNAPAKVIAHFKKFPPKTGIGRFALARAHLKSGDKKNAAKWIRMAWRESDMSSAVEKKIMKEMGNLITTSDRRDRLSVMVYRQKTNNAISAASYLPKSYRVMAKSAVAFIRRSKNARKLYDRVPPELRKHPAITYARVRWLRKAGRDANARTLLLTAPTDHAKLLDPVPWWIERRLLARAALRPGKTDAHKAAYKLVSNHGFTKGAEFVEAEFLSGWISKRFLKDSKTALKHFLKLRTDATLPATISRAEYWTGRAYSALGNAAKANQHFNLASGYTTTYYGQLARDEIGLPAPKNTYTRRPSAPAAVKAKLDKDERVRAVRMIAAAGRNDLLPSFLSALAYSYKTADERVAVAELAWKYKLPHRAVRIARIADRYGQNLGRYAYPTSLLPRYKKVVRGVEKSLVYGLIRQESEFDITARSRVGAQGLMQIMPATAKAIARDHKQKYNKAKLTREPAYNLTLGTAHIHDLLAEFDGSYIMMIAAYNAGASRPRKWMERYGDPRKGEIDPIDWVETIPFTETRNYVQKVLQNVQVYRSIFTEKKNTGLTNDLRRGSVARPVQASGCVGATRKKSIEALIACN